MAFLFTKLIHLLFLSSLLITFHSPSASSQPTGEFCTKEANYTANSTFQANLNTLLSSLSSTTPTTGFSNNTKGSDPDQVYGLAQCRGDLTANECQSCLDTATQAIVQRCPQGKIAFVWYDNCLLRYSNQNFFSIADTSYRIYRFNTQNSSEPDRLMELVGNRMDLLTTRAAYSSSGRMFATGEDNFTSFTKLYSLVQCTRDLLPDGCEGCLIAFITDIQRFYGKEGLTVLGQSCYLRYDLFRFYNVSAGGAAPPPPTTTTTPPPPPPAAVSPSPGDQEKKNNTTKIILIVLIPVVAALVFFFAICIWLQKRKRVKRILKNRLDGGDEQEIRSAESLLFDLGTLKAATSNFSDANKLGEGGFGPVYKGALPNGQEIAVKRLSRNSAQGLVELKNEVLLVARLQHRNLVRLLGFCLEEQEMLLVYEFLPNTSLDKFLFDPIKRQQLDWGRRFKIIEGIGRGLLYLHEDSRLKIIHRDLKASNILLDRDMNPKISDFGLAKLFGGDQTQGSTSRIAGTYGYMAPEYARRGQFSTKSDVFSFGVLVLEIVTGRSNCGFHRSGRAADLLSYVWQHWNDGMALQLLDRSLGELYQTQEVLRCINIGLLCVQEDALRRPNMSSVVLMLSSFSVTLPTPFVPAFFIQRSVTSNSEVLRRDGNIDSSESEYSNQNNSGPRPPSVNDVTISELDPR